MASDDAAKFLDKVDQDSELQDQLREHQANLVKLGQEHGFEFTQQELHAHLRDRWGVTKPPAYDDPDTTTVG